MKYEAEVICLINEQYLKEVAEEEFGDTYEEVVEEGYEIMQESQSFHDYFYESLVNGVDITDDERSYEREAGKILEKELDNALQKFYEEALEKEIQETPDYIIQQFNRVIDSTLKTRIEIEDMKLLSYADDYMRLEVTSSLEEVDLPDIIEEVVRINTQAILETLDNDYSKNLSLSYFERPLSVSRKGSGFTSIALKQKVRGLYTKLENISRID